MPASAPPLWEVMAGEAARESGLWAAALLPPGERAEQPVFSPLAEGRFALGLESIYEAYLLHYGRPRLFAPPDRDTAVLLGDYLYAHGLVRIAALGEVEVVAELAELISLCAHARAEGLQGDGPAWAATAAQLGRADERLAGARLALLGDRDPGPLARLAEEAAGVAEVQRALALHAGLVD